MAGESLPSSHSERIGGPLARGCYRAVQARTAEHREMSRRRDRSFVSASGCGICSTYALPDFAVQASDRVARVHDSCSPTLAGARTLMREVDELPGRPAAPEWPS